MLMDNFCLSRFEFREGGADGVRVEATYIQIQEGPTYPIREGVEVKDEGFPADLHPLLAILRAGEVGHRIEAGGFLLLLQERVVSGGYSHLIYTGEYDPFPPVADEDVALVARAIGMTPDEVRSAVPKKDLLRLVAEVRSGGYLKFVPQ